MDDELIGRLRAGKTATFIIFEKPEEGIGIPVALNGFGDGFDALPWPPPLMLLKQPYNTIALSDRRPSQVRSGSTDGSGVLTSPGLRS